jgi:osmoprotectant transport system substrate-binding protein
MHGLRRGYIVALLAGLLLAGCGDDGSEEDFGGEESAAADQGSVTIAGQDFTGGQVMTELYAQLLESEGYTPNVKLVGTRDLYMPELKSGRVQVVPEYLAGITDFLNTEANGVNAKPVSTNDVEETLSALEPLAEEAGITMLEPSQASDQNAFFVTTERAEEEGLATLSDLAATGEPVTLAAPPDCKGRDDCEKGLSEVYGLDIDTILPTGYGTTQTKEAVIEGEADLGETGTTDGSLEELGLVLLEDDKGIQPAQNLTPALNSEWFAEHNEVEEVLNDFSAQFTTEDLADLSLQVDVDRADPAEVAQEYLTEKGLI